MKSAQPPTPSLAAASSSLWLTVFVILSVGLAVWLLPASAHVVGWNRVAVERVVLLPAFGVLVWWVLGLAAFTLCATVASRLTSVTPGRLARHLSPLLLLFTWTIPYVPLLSSYFPALLIFAGPLRWIVAAMAVVGCAISIIGPGPWLRTPIVATTRTVFLLSLAIYLALGLLNSRSSGPGGDEPHYLVIAHSLLVDRDLDIENNHEQGDYRGFFGGKLRPDYLRRGVGGVIYSIHPFLLPALLVPAYSLGGYTGAVVFVCLLSAIAATLIFGTARRIAGLRAAWLTWLAVAVSMPFGAHAWMIYPEVPAALIAAAAVWWLCAAAPVRGVTWLTRGVVLALLPWFHTKFSVLLMGVLLCLSIQARQRWRNVVALVAPTAVSGALWLWSFFIMFGVPNPTAAYGSTIGTSFSNWHIPRGMLGLMFDQEFGLLLHAPVYALAPFGFWRLWQSRPIRWQALTLALAILGFGLGVTRVYMWWGGSSAPARFLVPVVPLVAPMLALGWRDLPERLRGAALAALAISVSIFLFVTLQPELRLLIENRDGVSALVTYVEGPAPFWLALPTFIGRAWATQLPAVLVVLLAALTGTLLASAVWQRRARPELRTYWSAAAGLLAALAAFAILSGLVVRSDRREEFVNSSKVKLLLGYDPMRLHALAGDSLRRVSEPQLFRLGTLEVSAKTNEPPDPVSTVAGPFELPAGRYEAHVWFKGGRDLAGEIAVVYGRRQRQTITRLGGTLPNPALVSFSLPVTAPSIRLDTETPAVVAQLARIQLVPRFIVPRSVRPDIGIRSLRAIPGWPGAFILFADDNAYPEQGFSWIRGGRRAAVWIAPSGALSIKLTVQGGAVAGPVTVTMAGRKTELRLAPWESRDFMVSVPRDSSLVPIAIEPAGGFRPADFVRTSKDRRWLGCRIRIDLTDL